MMTQSRIQILRATLLFLLMLVPNDAFSAPNGLKVLQIAAGSEFSCALYSPDGSPEKNEVHCWGEGAYSQTRVPSLKRPIQIATGLRHACALDEEGVKCWGDNKYGQSDVPTLNHPSQVALGNSFSCAIDQDGVKCWGYNGYGQTSVPPLANPRRLALGSDHACALDQNGARCWGNSVDSRLDIPPLQNPTHIAAGWALACAIDREDVFCWGRGNFGLGYLPKPALDHPIQIAVGWVHKCAIDRAGAKCWGSNEYGQSLVPELNTASLIAAGGNHSCAHDRYGIKCWGANTFLQTVVPPHLGSFAALNMPTRPSIGELLKILAMTVAPPKGAYLKLLSVFASEHSDPLSSTFISHAVAPMVFGNDSQGFAEHVHLAFRRYLEDDQTSPPIRSIHDVPDSPEARRASLTTLRAALEAAKSFSSPSDRPIIARLLAAVGQAQTHPQGSEPIQALLRTFAESGAWLDSLETNPRTRWIAETLEQNRDWLRLRTS